MKRIGINYGRIVDLLLNTIQVTSHGEWSTIITFDTTKRRNPLLLQDCGTVIIGGSNQTPAPTASQLKLYSMHRLQLF